MKTALDKKFILNLTESFLSTWALMKASRMEPGNILTIILFLLCIFFYQRINTRLVQTPLCNNKHSSRTASIIAVVFTVFYMAVDYPNYIASLTNPLFRMGILTAVFLGFSILFYRVLLLLFSYTGNIQWVTDVLLDNNKDAVSASAPQDTESNLPSPSSFMHIVSAFYRKRCGLCCFLICLLGWLPYFLYQYPGIMTPDSVNQFEQLLGIIPYSNHHPWMHTLLFKLFYTLGYSLTESMLVGVSCYTFFQMCLLAFSASYFIGTLRYYHIRPGICLALTLFYALIPYHGVFSVTIWKDIPFAAALLLFITAMVRFFDKIRSWDLVVFLLSGMMVCLFRSNGWYGFLLCVPFLLITFRKKAKLVYPILALILITAAIIKYPVMNAFHVTQPDTIESLSIPTQQVAAVICNDRYLTEEQLSLIENVIDLTYIKELYNPTFADNMKELVRAGNQEYLASHKAEFFKLWLQLGLKYPGDYLSAYISQTNGYWYPDSYYLVAEAEGISASSLGVSHTPLLSGPLVVKAKEIAIKLGSMLPLYGTLWSMGVAFWVLIFCVGNTLIRREYQKLILYLPALSLVGTVLIATPVATEFRYVYFLIFSLPFYPIISMLPMTEPRDNQS